jgi:hypothetical protein
MEDESEQQEQVKQLQMQCNSQQPTTNNQQPTTTTTLHLLHETSTSQHTTHFYLFYDVQSFF